MGGGGSWSSCSAARTAAAAAPGHARLGLETAFREDARALRARLHPFGRSRLELGYRDTLDALPMMGVRTSSRLYAIK